jgi:hypothetical protein
MTDTEKEILCLEMQKVGLVQRGERQRWCCTAKGHHWGAALYGIALAEQYNSEPYHEQTCGHC